MGKNHCKQVINIFLPINHTGLELACLKRRSIVESHHRPKFQIVDSNSNRHWSRENLFTTQKPMILFCHKLHIFLESWWHEMGKIFGNKKKVFRNATWTMQVLKMWLFSIVVPLISKNMNEGWLCQNYYESCRKLFESQRSMMLPWPILPGRDLSFTKFPLQNSKMNNCHNNLRSFYGMSNSNLI